MDLTKLPRCSSLSTQAIIPRFSGCKHVRAGTFVPFRILLEAIGRLSCTYSHVQTSRPPSIRKCLYSYSTLLLEHDHSSTLSTRTSCLEAVTDLEESWTSDNHIAKSQYCDSCSDIPWDQLLQQLYKGSTPEVVTTNSRFAVQYILHHTRSDFETAGQTMRC